MILLENDEVIVIDFLTWLHTDFSALKMTLGGYFILPHPVH